MPAHFTNPLALSLSALAAAAHLAAASPLRPAFAAGAGAAPLEARSPAPVPAPAPQALTVPLVRRGAALEKRRDADSFLRKAQGMRSKYGAWAPGSRDSTAGQQQKRQNDVPMTSYQDSEWYGEIDVGTPPAAFSVVLDTGSADLILAETGCNGCSANTPGYEPSTSSTSATSQSAFSIQYGSGSASGTLVRDTISIGNFTQPDQIFAACDTLENIVDGTISGILGLGWTALASSGETPLVEALWRNGTLPEGVFGFAFETHTFTTASSPTAPGGTLTIGGVDTSAFSGELNWINIVQPAAYWAIPLQDVHVGGQSLGLTDAAVVIDTGTTLIGAPQRFAEAVYAQVPGAASISLQGESGYYSFPCSQSVNVSMTFGGVEYTIAPDQFNAGAVNSRGSLCLGAVFALETSASSTVDIIVGDAFLTGVYSAYRFSDPPAVGFATRGSGGSANTGTTDSSSSGSTGAAMTVPVGKAAGAIALAASVAALVLA
ncbi:uncharacterized protein RHOBADRAFT_50594 [Rhodotorula graminis WP1]|uniref:Peptidase A1 domain-containing protein n=1 Tax=Rhodotorula graminis (strain WP1) TaxID=578459 RepID=A0A194SEY0_RHOGW|nr:uncharacterized protein RHOBADRAFT_50594 [Rhodotorula graminis WP1]KPV78081.1 hypothetical protein RHOBADRAFT_50594 [Rhodotorula graminis WP1]